VTLEAPENAALLVAGVASDFDCAFNSFVVVGALIGEEFEDALQTADRWPYDQRTVTAAQARYSQNSCTALGLYTPLQAARVSASNVRHLLEGWTDAQVPNRQLLIARVSAYEAWNQLFLAEAFCETVFSTIRGETIDWGTRSRARRRSIRRSRDSAAQSRPRRASAELLPTVFATSHWSGERARITTKARWRAHAPMPCSSRRIRLERDRVEQQHASPESRVPGEQHGRRSVVERWRSLPAGLVHQ
jgi:hypothetical protein